MNAPTMGMMFRKKPVVIEAVQFTGKNHEVIGEFCGFSAALASPDCVVIKTLKGEMRAEIGDWIIKGVKGEFYPIKDQIFRETYEETVA